MRSGCEPEERTECPVDLSTGRSDEIVLDDILQDIRALKDQLGTYEQKYGVPSETFCESCVNSQEPPDNASVQHWTAWASAYKVWLRRQEQYQAATQSP